VQLAWRGFASSPSPDSLVDVQDGVAGYLRAGPGGGGTGPWGSEGRERTGRGRIDLEVVEGVTRIAGRAASPCRESNGAPSPRAMMTSHLRDAPPACLVVIDLSARPETGQARASRPARARFSASPSARGLPHEQHPLLRLVARHQAKGCGWHLIDSPAPRTSGRRWKTHSGSASSPQPLSSGNSWCTSPPRAARPSIGATKNRAISGNGRSPCAAAGASGVR